MNISFSLTTDQVRRAFQTGEIEKDVTRRLGWKRLCAGQILTACRKCMGLKRGESIDVLGQIRVASVRREPLRLLTDDITYGLDEIRREGFASHPMLQWPSEWVKWFCESHKGCTPQTEVTRIEFEYLRAK